MRKLILLIVLASSSILEAQKVEIHGEALVTQMNVSENIDDVVVRQADGTLGVRSAQSIASSVQDTSRNLASDLALAQHLCDCGSDLPPFLVESLLDAGYTTSDLQLAGVSPTSIIPPSSTVSDIDGNTYESVVIGDQKWFTTGLRTTKFNDGSPIYDGQVFSDFVDLLNDGKAGYRSPGGLIANVPTMGYIYTPAVAQPTQNGNLEACPVGWRTPTKVDFENLREAIDPGSTNFTNDAGQYLKNDDPLWLSPNSGANDIYGFNAYPSGSCWPTSVTAWYTARNQMLSSSFNGSLSAIFTAYLTYNEVKMHITAAGYSTASGSIRCVSDL